MVAVRDAVGELPAVPPFMWLGGVLLILGLRASRMHRFRRRIRAGAPAPASARAMVVETAAAMGLARVPKTVFVAGRVSPMIWCGREAVLILPRDLWSVLDPVGRKAILCHELAHVRRRDHWVSWIESIIGAIYWWHPLVWWIRSRLAEEAEHSCDAWVTWLLPKGRRAYAEALLATRCFVSKRDPISAGAGIGVLTGKTGRFARRLTMVMTRQTIPNLSGRGLALAAMILAAGWVATPARSADRPPPPVPAPDAPEVHSPHLETAVVAPRVADAPRPRSFDLTAPGGVVVTVGGMPPAPDGHAGAPEHLEGRISRLERRLNEVSKQLDRLSRSIESAGGGGAARLSDLLKHAEEQIGTGTGAQDRLNEALRLFDRVRGGVAAPSFTPAGVGVRRYELPTGKLAALTKLMVRADVPIRVRPLDGAIEVHATEADHAVFKAFVDSLSGEEQVVSYHLPPGKLHALAELLSRDDVPIMIEPAENEIRVHGGPATQAVVRAFIEMINRPAATSGASPRGWIGPRASAEAAALRALVEEKSVQARGRAGSIRARLLGERAERRAMLRELQHRHEETQREMERLEEAADNAQDEAERLHAQAEDLREEAERSDNPEESSHLRRKALDLDHRALEMENEARELQARAEALEREGNEIEEQAEQIEQQLEEMREHMEEAAR